MAAATLAREPILDVQDLSVRFGAFAAVHDASFRLCAGEALGLVGESGSGKSTLARAILRLIPAAAGRVIWKGDNLLTLSATALRKRRRELQMVFQDPLASLNPRLTIGETLAEPLRIFERLSPSARRSRMADMLGRVGLSDDVMRRYPHEFSGGQCQRLGIARAMMPNPELLVCDEAVSSLDVSVQGQIVNLLADLQRDSGMAMLFISHNLAVVRHLTHRLLVMYRGRLVESADTQTLFASSVHPYTRELLRAAIATALGPAPGIQATPEVSAPEFSTAGCVFRTRCSYAAAECAIEPRLQEIAAGHRVACHRWREVVYSSLHENGQSSQRQGQ